MSLTPFTRLAIVNRGEAAMRAIRAVRELNALRAEPIRIIALCTSGERRALFARQADEVVDIGPARPGYLDLGALERALRESRADAAWAGWGFVAESPEFAELCDRLGVVFIGPSAAAMRAVGDKIAAKRLAEAAGVPVAPWSGGPVGSVDEALAAAERIGFPLMVKSAAGGGGRGIRRVASADQLPEAFRAARSEVGTAFGDDTLLLERVIAPARHVEVQIIADGHGTAWAVGVRDCSCQRRHQKVLEESASTALSHDQERELCDAAVRLMTQAGYRSAGTVEFLYEPTEQRASFLEVNPRLQVEHPVTEMVTGLDLVKLQLHVAAGGRLHGEPPAPRGHAIEVRLNAEDPAQGFSATAGRVQLLRLPAGPGVRVDSGIAEGDEVPPEFDSLLAKVIAWGTDRDEALGRLRRALAETTVVLDGGTTDQGFLLDLLDRREVRAGEVDTAWLDDLRLHGALVPERHAEIALLQAAIDVAEDAEAVDRARFYAFARRGRPEAATAVTRRFELRHRGHAYRFDVARVAPSRYRIEVDGAVVEADVERLGPHERRLVVGDRAHRTLTSGQDVDLLVEVDGVPHRVARDDGGVVRNLAPAVVVSVPVAEGDQVEAGDVVAVVESMKMESSFAAPFRGRVRRVLVGPNTHVGPRAPLVVVEPLGDRPAADGNGRVRFPDTSGAPVPDLTRLEWLTLGYDVAGAEASRIAAALAEPGDAERARLEDRVLQRYGDVQALARHRHDDEEDIPARARSPHEHFLAWLRSLDAEAEGLPESVQRRLLAVLSHYGIASLDRTAALEDAAYRVFLAQQRAEIGRPAVQAVLERRLNDPATARAQATDDLRAILAGLTGALDGRDPVLADLSRECQRACFEEPIRLAALDAVYAEVDAHLAALDADPQGADRAARITALVDCTRPLVTTLAARMAGASRAQRRNLLEVMTRRFYRTRSLAGFDDVDGFLAGTYRFAGERRHVLTAFVDAGELVDAQRRFAAWAAGSADGAEASLDLYAMLPDADAQTPTADLAADLERRLGEMPMPASVHRIVVALAAPERGRGMDAVEIFTFRIGPEGLREDPMVRGLHPMMADRLHLWRLERFALTRLPAAEDVYLFHGVAREAPTDERLFALAEVRDLTPVRDDAGRVIALPELERMLDEALEGIRRFQVRRPASRRLQWNRVLMRVWPVLDLPHADLERVMRRVAHATEGLGIEVVQLRGRVREPGGEVAERVVRVSAPGGSGLRMIITPPPLGPLQPLDEGAKRIVSARRRGTPHPAEIIQLLEGDFQELDLDEQGHLVPVDRPIATNAAGIVAGLTTRCTDRRPEGMRRVALFGDPTKALGSLAEAECRRINAALDLAQELQVPLEWFAISAGARIAMDSGTENMDWIADVLRRIIEFTQAGGELNVVVTGINVGAQPYWNAEATMLMHTRGILVMTPASAMVLTGKQALDYSGGVSAEDNFGIGGYERIMGPNGQAQYWAPDLASACRLLLDHYDHTYVMPGERFPRRGPTIDPFDRDVCHEPHHAPGTDLATIGELFDEATNPGRKKPFDIRSVMRATIDHDHTPLERWAAMQDAESAVVWEAHLGGRPVMMLGLESRPLRRYGSIPADGPDRWTSGTLFPRSSKKIARAVNAAGGRRPIVVLANLAGFDGSPESMRRWQLEFGAEIGRAVVNCRGPIVFCVVSRYHGGAFVVFSQKLNPQLETVALEGAHASVIGGAPAAAVVFSRDVDVAARRDPRIAELDERLEHAEGAERARLRVERAALWQDVRAEHMGRLAAEFDAIHSVERAVRMGSVTRIIAPSQMRPYLIDAVERGIRRTLELEGIRDGGRVAATLRG